MMKTTGPSLTIRETLHQTLTIAEDLTLSPGHILSFVILHTLNEYHLDHNVKTVLSIAEKNIKYLGVPPNLIQQVRGSRWDVMFWDEMTCYVMPCAAGTCIHRPVATSQC